MAKLKAGKAAAPAPKRKAPGAGSMTPKIIVSKRFTSTSYSRLRDYEKCAYYAALKHLQKLSEGPEGPALARGNEVHKAAEDYINGKLKKLPPDLQAVKELIDGFKKRKARPEVMWGFTRELSPADWFDWARCFLRVKADVWEVVSKVRATIVDWKTGRYREEDIEAYRDQLKQYAPAAFVMAPKTVKQVEARIEFVDHAKHETDVYSRKDAELIQVDMERRWKPMLNDTRYSPRPGNHCRFCKFKKSNDGPCPY